MCHNDLVFIAVSLSDTTLYPSPRSSLCIFFHYFHVTKKKGVILINSKKKKTRENMGKNIKIMPQPNSPFPQEREGSLTAKKKKKKKKVQIFQLKYGTA